MRRTPDLHAAAVAMVLSLIAIPAVVRADGMGLTWTPDSGIRVTGPSGAVRPTFVMQRPDALYGMYFYDGDAWTFGDTGYATSADGTNWTYQGRVLTHGGHGFDNIDAVIDDIIKLPGDRLRAYGYAMQSNQSPVATSVFYTETNDPYGVSWTGDRHVLFEGTALFSPRVLGSAADGYTMYFVRDNQVVRTTSGDGINWGAPQVVVQGSIDSFDIAELPGGSLRMFAQVSGQIRSLTSGDGIVWSWDAGVRLAPSQYGESVLGTPAVAEVAGQARMYLTVYPDRSGVYSATAGENLPPPPPPPPPPPTSIVPLPAAVWAGLATLSGLGALRFVGRRHGGAKIA